MQIAEQVKKYKAGEPHPTDKNLVFRGYNKRFPGKEFWITKERFNKWQGLDGFWYVYYLPKENYYGSTSKIFVRIQQHAAKGKDVSNYSIIGKFENKRDALDLEKKMQLENNANGYIFTKKWRKRMNSVHKGKQKIIKKVICVNTGEIFNNMTECRIKNGLSRSQIYSNIHHNSKNRTANPLQFKFI